MVKWSGYVHQGTGVGTGVQLWTVEQECLLLEANVKHSEVQNLFSLLNETSAIVNLYTGIVKKYKRVPPAAVRRVSVKVERRCAALSSEPSENAFATCESLQTRLRSTIKPT